MNSGGWAVFPPNANGKQIQVHLTPSDVNAPNHVLQELNKHGFAEAEAQWANDDEAERKRKIKEAQAQAQQKLDEAQRKADREMAALAKAAGINVRVNESLILSAYPVPKSFERVLVTPDLAEKLLALNTDNRPIRPHDVDFWADVMERGEWLYTHQGIAIDTRGVLQDGQHRLSAIVRTGIACEMMISIGMPQKNFNVVDTGSKRSGGDVVWKYRIASRHRISSMARMIIIFDEFPRRAFNDRVSNTEIDNMVAEHGGTMLEAYNRGQAVYQSSRILPTAAGVGIFLLWRQVGRDHPLVEEFVRGVISGADLQTGDPRLALRNTNINQNSRKRNSVHQLALFLKAWNYFLAKRPLKILAFRKDEDFPQVNIPSENVATETPEAATVSDETPVAHG